MCAAGRLSVPRSPELNRVAAELLPCALITPLDCYWEGSILQEPDDFVEPVNASDCLVNSPHGNDTDGITWGNIDFNILGECLLASPGSGFTVFLNAVCFLCVVGNFISLPRVVIGRCRYHWVC